ncbi:MAG: glutamate--cysteine ligase, partial [Polaromonas sp.]
SPPDTPAEIAELKHNQHQTAARGREPGVTLKRAGHDVPLTRWGAEVLAECAPIAAALDEAHGGTQYRDALAAAAAGLADANTLPSARVLAAMTQDFDNSFMQFARDQSLKNRDALQSLPLTDGQLARFTALSQQSVEEQKKIEAAESLPFEEYRQQYVSSECLGVLLPEAVQA